MISFPNAKINIGLYVTGKRDDGFHNIESIFYPVPFKDALEIIPANEFSFQTEGIQVVGNIEDNLCVEAYRLLQNLFDLPPVQMFLLKNIPAGAGLGGGSSDASFTLKILNKIFDLKLTVGQLGIYAAQLGSDCPFFITNYPAYVFGRGELMEAVNISLQGKYIVIICPGIHIGTAEAYQNITAFSKPVVPLPHLIQRDRPYWTESLQNDFEPYAFKKYPVLKAIKEKLYASGAFYASMSGSGSAIYGLFEQKPETDFSELDTEGKFLVWNNVLG
jgi:4-diphosphocytidyl-2-C-methyl-D-erythritol kinase